MEVPFRIGYGFDLHRLEEGRSLWVGGVLIPSDKGSVAHSDGDVLLHAICDALLGALALGDIGTHFPDTDPAYKNKESSFFLQQVLELLRQHEAKIVNIDATIILEKPSLKNFKSLIVQKLSEILHVPENHISVKAKTHEKIGELGQGKAIAAHVVVLLFMQKN